MLNSVFLYHAVKAGLDLAIINPAHTRPYAEIPPEQREVAEALIFNREPQALARYIAFFEGVAPEAEAGDAPRRRSGSCPRRPHPLPHPAPQEGGRGVPDRRRPGAAHGGRGRAHDVAVDVLNGVLLPAMKEVGDKFGAGELILPYVLQSAEVMKRSVAHLEQYLEKVEGVSKGKVILATVYGDVHDIGKSLVNTILSNNGYTVYDLGKQVPVNVILDKAVEVGADAIGLSALLVSTSRQMPLCAQELHHRGLTFPLIIGGAAINRRFGRRINWVDEQQATLYGAGSTTARTPRGPLYRRPAARPRAPGGLLARLQQEVQQQREEERARAKGPPARRPRPSPRCAAPRCRTPRCRRPFWGHRTLAPDWRFLDQLLPHLDRNTLFRHHWKYTIHDRAEWQRLVDEELEPRLRTLWASARVQRWLTPGPSTATSPCRRTATTWWSTTPPRTPPPPGPRRGRPGPSRSASASPSPPGAGRDEAQRGPAVPGGLLPAAGERAGGRGRLPGGHRR